MLDPALRTRIADADRAILLNPQDWASRLTRGSIYLAAGEYDLALSDFQLCTSKCPDCASAYACRAEAYCRIGNYLQALSDANRAVHLDPNSAYHWHVLGLVDLMTDQYSRALNE